MQEVDKSKCGSGCSNCSVWSVADQGHMGGWRLVLNSMAVFVLPVILAIVGAALAGTTPEAEFLGVLVGLAVGAGLAWVISRWIGVKERKAHELDNQ